MTPTFTCPRGHQWQVLRGDDSAAANLGQACPVCAAPDQTPPPPEHATVPQPAPSSTPRPASIPVALPGYEFLGELGRGGMGVVYQAHQVGLNRVVAVKTIREVAFAGPEMVARFRGEAEALGKLAHPNIVQVHTVEEQDGRPCIVMELVEGGSLARALDGTPWDGRRAAALVEPLARAIEATHRVGIIHRDLKPGNVLLTREGLPKISDFGLARSADGPQRTHTGDVVGTPSYMAPEQAAGNATAVGPLADVYALGAILYELLTGGPPFRAPTPLETLRQVCDNEPVAPRSLQPGVPCDLETICLKCLEKDAGRRYRTAAALADDLGRFLRGEPVRARPVGPAARAWRWCLRNRAVATLAAGVVLSLVAGVVAASVFALRANASARSAAEQRDRAREQRDRSRARFGMARETVDRLLTRMSQSALMKGQGPASLRQKMLEDAAASYERFAQEEDADPEVRAEQAKIGLRLGELYRDLGKWDDAEKAFERARDTFRELATGQPDAWELEAGLAHSYQGLGRLYRDSNRLDPAEQAFDECVAAYRRAFGSRPDVAARKENRLALSIFHENLAPLYAATGRPGKAEEAADEALRLRERLVDEHPDDEAARFHLATSLNNRALDEQRQKRYEAAERDHRKAIALLASLAVKHPEDPDCQRDLAKSYGDLAACYGEWGQLDRAAEAFGEAIAPLKVLCEAQPEVLDYAVQLGGCYCNVGNNYGRKGDAANALRQYEEAVKVLGPVVKKEPRLGLAREYLRNTCHARAVVLKKTRAYAEAAASWARALELDDGSHRADFEASRITAVAHAGDHKRALADLQAWTPTVPPQGWVYYRIACIFASLSGAAGRDAGLSAGERETLAERYAAGALEHLDKACKEGFFRDPAMVTHVKGNIDFDVLRPRPAFQKLLTEVSGR